MRGLKYLGMVYCNISSGYLETTPSGYNEGMASVMGVLHAKTLTTPRIRTWHSTVDVAREPVFRAIVGKEPWILRARPDVLYVVKEPSCWLQGPREVDNVAAKRMVKYLYGTRDTALELRPRKGPLRLDSPSDSDWAGCPTTRKSSSGAMVWCTREFALPDTTAHGLVVTRSRVLRVHSGGRRSKVCPTHSSRLG